MTVARRALHARRGPVVGDPLDPVRCALLSAARDEARLTVAAARLAAAEATADARDRARSVIERATAEGAAAADDVLVGVRARDRRLAHRLSLEAQRQVWEELRRRAISAVEGLVDEPDYPRLAARLVATARARLDEAAEVSIDGPEGPGVVAQSGNRRIDLRLDRLADRALARLGPRVQEMWR
ncbi:MAG TPA: hypothetical protein VFH45_11505 [Acidimicrobiales bacterium]|nr:hypothetical protein [Acidimicrobiales bacterium]